MAYEEPPFNIVHQTEVYEIRHYVDRLAVQATYNNQDSNFRMLFNYISGANVNSEKIFVVTQTTLSVDDTHDIIENINTKFPMAEIRNDICYATTNRQAAVKELAKKADLILVVGSPNSSNSVRLMEHARSAGVTAYRIEGIEEIEEDWFKNIGIVGLTAGASVPDELLDPIINSLMAKGIEKIDTITVAQETVEFKPPNDLPIPRRTLTQ